MTEKEQTSQPVTSEVPLGSIVGPTLLSIFTNDINDGMECSLSKLVDDIELQAAVSVLEGSAAIQGDLGKLKA